MASDDTSSANAPDLAKQERVEQERTRHAQRNAAHFATRSESEDAVRGEGGERETTEPRVFTVVRRADESGVSGTGRVLDGCVFHNGQVVICWRGDINSETSGYASLAIYPCWDAFHTVHIASHPGNETEVIFGHDGDLMARVVDRAAERDGDAPSDAPDEEEAEEEAAEAEEAEA